MKIALWTLCSESFKLLCSHSHNDFPRDPQRNISMAAELGTVRPSITPRQSLHCLSVLLLKGSMAGCMRADES